MTLFCVRDGDSLNDTQWNQPLKKIEKPAPTKQETYIPTPTPGVVIDSQTGKMETQIPENENANLLGGGAKHYLPTPASRTPIFYESLPKAVKAHWFSWFRRGYNLDKITYYDQSSNSWTTYYRDFNDQWTFERQS